MILALVKARGPASDRSATGPRRQAMTVGTGLASLAEFIWVRISTRLALAELTNSGTVEYGR
jgi:hypothetical protein